MEGRIRHPLQKAEHSWVTEKSKLFQEEKKIMGKRIGISLYLSWELLQIFVRK